MKWIFAINEALDAAGMIQADITDRKTFTQNVDWNVGQMEKCKKTATLGSDERKRAHSKRIKKCECKERRPYRLCEVYISRGKIGPICE